MGGQHQLTSCWRHHLSLLWHHQLTLRWWPADLQDLSPKERTALLRVVGLSLQQAEEVDAFIAALPTLALVSECGVDGEDAIYEQDIVKCTVLHRYALRLLIAAC